LVMKKPTLKEAKEYAKKEGLTIDVEYWYDKNEEKGWVWTSHNKTHPMKNWKANMRVWQRNKDRWANKNSRPARNETFLDSYYKGKNG